MRLDQLGFIVFAGCLSPSGSGAKRLVSMASGHLVIVPADVTNDESVEQAAEFVKENLGDNS